MYPTPEKDYDILVRCYCYNQAIYIEETLKGFVKQQTSYSFVCVVVDDCSTDGTQEIIQRYAALYPCIIVPILLEENYYSQKKSKDPIVKPWRERCKYEAICEGDDYWIDPLKLQKQVDILESNPNVMMVHTGFFTVDENGHEISRPDYEKYMEKSFSGNVLAQLFEGNYIMTLTKCLRTNIYNTELFKGCPETLDYQISMTAASLGDVAYLPERTACYRKNPDSLMSTNINTIHKKVASIKMYFGEQMLAGNTRTISRKDRKPIEAFLIRRAWFYYRGKQENRIYLRRYLQLKPSLALIIIKDFLSHHIKLN